MSPAQVGGSAVAAVVAAVLAGQLGVYGTFVGAGVVSVVATTGGPVFQHFFRRTGEEIKGRSGQVEPRLRKSVPPQRAADTPAAPLQAPPGPSDGGTRPLRQADGTRASPQTDGAREPGRAAGAGVPSRAGDDRTRLLRAAGPHPADGTSGADDPATRLLRQPGTGPAPEPEEPPHFSGEYTEGVVQGTKWRGWKKTLLPAALTFVLAVGGITVYELISGGSVSGGSGTSLSRAVHPGADEKPAGTPDDDGPTPAPESTTPDGEESGVPTPGTTAPDSPDASTGTPGPSTGDTGSGASTAPGTDPTPAPQETGTTGEDGTESGAPGTGSEDSPDDTGAPQPGVE